MQMDDADANADAAAAAVTPANAVEDNRAKTKATRIHRILTDPSLDSDIKQQQIAAIYDCWGTQPPTVSSFKSSSRSSPPDSFHGHAKDHGQPAQSWLYSVELYFQAEYTPNPVAKAVTYLHGEARRWWQQIGSKTLSSTASFEMFSQAFLACFVKPSDSAKARAEIPHLKQADLVESFASHFRSVNSRISVGSPIDTTTLASYFVRGLKSKLASALAAHCSLATMQELDSVISAAEEMEAKLNLAAKQDQPSLAAIAAPQRGDSGAARKARGGAAGGCTPYSRGGGNVGRVNNAGRGNNGRGRSNQPSYSRFAAASPAQGANTEPLGNRIADHVSKNAGAARYNSAEKCGHCHIAGHSIHD